MRLRLVAVRPRGNDIAACGASFRSAPSGALRCVRGSVRRGLGRTEGVGAWSISRAIPTAAIGMLTPALPRSFRKRFTPASKHGGHCDGRLAPNRRGTPGLSPLVLRPLPHRETGGRSALRLLRHPGILAMPHRLAYPTSFELQNRFTVEMVIVLFVRPLTASYNAL